MKPEAGQTWVNEKFGDKVYFIGRCANGIMVFQVEGNEIEHGDLDWSGWRLMQPEDIACDECGGSGEIDSGGSTQWMAQPQKTRVRLWMRNDPKGRPSLFACDERPYPDSHKYVEIHHDSEGFYVID